MYTTRLAALLIAASAAALAGCSPSGAPGSVDQSTMCVASTDQEAMQCPEGELMLARLDPRTEQRRAYNVLNTVALYCDTNHRIVQNDAGVVCVLTKARIDTLAGRRSTRTGGNGLAGDNGSSGTP